MTCNDTIYCFNRKKDTELLADKLKESGGFLNYCAVKKNNDNTYSLSVGGVAVFEHVSFAKVMAYILRKFW